jgi:hypothetical protein
MPGRTLIGSAKTCSAANAANPTRKSGRNGRPSEIAFTAALAPWDAAWAVEIDRTIESALVLCESKMCPTRSRWPAGDRSSRWPPAASGSRHSSAGFSWAGIAGGALKPIVPGYR